MNSRPGRGSQAKAKSWPRQSGTFATLTSQQGFECFEPFRTETLSRICWDSGQVWRQSGRGGLAEVGRGEGCKKTKISCGVLITMIIITVQVMLGKAKGGSFQKKRSL